MPECLAEELTFRKMDMVAKALPCANMIVRVLGNSEFRKRISGQRYLSVDKPFLGQLSTEHRTSPLWSVP